MDEVNPDLDSVDVCLVIGANDITNKAACDTPGCPIYGMPVIEAREQELTTPGLRHGSPRGTRGFCTEPDDTHKPRKPFNASRRACRSLDLSDLSAFGCQPSIVATF